MKEFVLLLCVEAFFQYHIEYEITSPNVHGFGLRWIAPREDTEEERARFWDWSVRRRPTFIREFWRHLAEWEHDQGA